MSSLTLYDYWRSSAAYRVRIALNLKGMKYDSVPVSLLAGEQRAASYRAQNPQGLVPMLSSDKGKFGQSLAIIEYLNETQPTPPLLPSDPEARAMVRAMAHVIASDIHPINNLRVQQYLTNQLGASDAQKTAWIHHWMADGFAALETLVKQAGSNGKFCIGSESTMADICLVPQIYNARRFKLDLKPYPTLVAIDAHCSALPAFIAAQPEKQKDAA
jgi:maleylacetoacetate isomerase